jgi:hypothetical protein
VSAHGLGAPGRLLPVTAPSLAACADVEPRGVALCGGSPAHGCGQAIQISEECHSGHLENVVSRGTDLPATQTPGADANRLSRSNLCRWKADE